MKITKKKLEIIIKEEITQVLKEFMSPVGLYAQESKEIFKKYLEQGVDESRSRALASIYGPLLFDVDRYFQPVRAAMQGRSQLARGGGLGDEPKKAAKIIGNAMGALAYAGMQGGSKASQLVSSASAQAKYGDIDLDNVAKLLQKVQGACIDLAVNGLQTGKSNIVEKNILIIAKNAPFVFNAIEQAGYTGVEGLFDYFKQTVQNATSNPPLESRFFTKQDFDEI
jgi:hypothetical protein